jgi:UDP-3-O-acyl-N-acetylglucosamine deacetylase
MSEPIPRKTLAAPVRVDGAGLFTGGAASVTIEPAEHGGIVFVRAGTTFPATIASLSGRAAHPAFAQMPARNTTLGAPTSESADAPVVHTVEHLMGALAGLGITDAIVRADSDELPIGDGSAGLFLGPILDAGVRTIAGATIEPIRPVTTIRVERDGASITIEPGDRIEYVYRLDYGPGAPIPGGEVSWDGDADVFARTIAPARTFCLESEARAMHALGLFTHLTPADMLVFGPDGPIENTLHSPDEPARHKLLDLIGDLALAGRPILGRVIADRSGHALTHEAVQRLVAAAGA